MVVADRRDTAVSERAARLIAVDGANGAAVAEAARSALSTSGRRRGGISWWDASGLFEQLTVAGDEAGLPSARTLLLLYAADLAFRLRWEIEPTLADGNTVVAAPYVDTAVAFGRAAGLPGGWLTNLFRFTLTPGDRRYVDAAAAHAAVKPHGFVEFACAQLSGRVLGLTRQQLAGRTRARLKARAARTQRPR